MNKDEKDDIAVEALIVHSVLGSAGEEPPQDQVDAFDAAASCLDERDRQQLREIDPLAKINESRQNNNNTIIEFPERSEDDKSWIQAAARQKNDVVLDDKTQSAIEKRRKEILERRNRNKDAGER